MVALREEKGAHYCLGSLGATLKGEEFELGIKGYRMEGKKLTTCLLSGHHRARYFESSKKNNTCWEVN
jgi:hypothetical protein